MSASHRGESASHRREEVPRDGSAGGSAPTSASRSVRGPAVIVVAVALAATAGFAGRGLWPGASRAATAASAVPVATATVVRADVASNQLVAGTLGYTGALSVVNESGPGIVTWLPSPGSVVRRGQPLFQLSGQPVFLFYGAVPAWRAFKPGMTQGPDVRELQRNLTSLGFSPGRADGQFGWSTEAAVERWQQAHGLVVTGTIPFGEVTFLPGPLRVTIVAAPLGGPVAAGAAVLSGTSVSPAVFVSLTVGGAQVSRGDAVLVTMPDGTTTIPGSVTSVGRVAVVAGGAGAQGSGGTPSATVPVTIAIGGSRLPAGLDQAPVQVAITAQRDTNVLAVPVTALLALPGGGYAVRVSGPAPRLIPVATGLFDDMTGLVEVTGHGLAAGLNVAVAQG
jgi:peptidoglycan hydrolase-like protein with peptidoglycan-binding domain